MTLSRHQPKEEKSHVSEDAKTDDRASSFNYFSGVLIGAISLTSYMVAKSFFNDIIFYPYTECLYCAIPFFFFAVYFYRRIIKFKIKDRVHSALNLFAPYQIFINALIASLSFFLCSIPLSLFITENSKKNAVEIYESNIDGVYVSSKSKNPNYYFDCIFKDENISRSISRNEGQKLNGTYKNYYVNFKVRKGPFDTYVIQNWEIRLKPTL